MLNFFAAWCAPCKRELPLLAGSARRSGPDVDYIGVDVADSRSNATDLLVQSDVPYRAGYDPNRDVAARYRVVGMPTTVFIRADGSIEGEVKGPVTASNLARHIRSIKGAG